MTPRQFLKKFETLQMDDDDASLSRVQEVWNSIPGPANIVLQMVWHRFNNYASNCVALVLWRGDGHRKLVTRFGVIRRV